MYDRKLLKSWAEMETWDQYLERQGAFRGNVSQEGFKFIEQEYFEEVKRRIRFCKKLLTDHEDSIVHYTLAELFNRCNLDERREYLYKRPVRYHCIKAIRINPNYAPLWALLAEAYDWVATLGGESRSMPKMRASVGKSTITVNVEHGGEMDKILYGRRQTMRLVEKAIRCLKEAESLDPENMTYHRRLREYYRHKAGNYETDLL